MNDSLSLYDIESGLVEAVSRYEEAMDASSIEEADFAEQALKAYISEEIRKVDGITGYIRFCESQAALAKAEALRLSERAGAWQGRVDRVKAMALGIMQTFGVPKFETALSSLRRQKNGGLAPLTITDPALVSDQYVKFAVTLTLAQWKVIVGAVGEIDCKRGANEIDLTRLRTAIEGGEKIPGVGIGERGEHLRVG